MSAICGYWSMAPASGAAQEAQTQSAGMLAALVSHGPESAAVHQTAALSLAHRLRAITPEDRFERQPLTPTGHETVLWPGNKPWLVADARIDNRAQLAADLEISPADLPTTPDSTFILRAWLRWGQDCLLHLIGSFAFAIWDERTQTLFLARDHAGDRPLYYAKTPNFFAFATTARALRILPGISAELDEPQLARDLLGLPPETPRTRFRDLQAIAPGHCLIVTRDAIHHRRYWQIDSLQPTRFAKDQDYVDAFLEIFDEAVRCRLRTSQSVATELSAGLDSGAVTATAARLLAPSGTRLAAYTAIPRPNFSGQSLIHPNFIADEGPFAAEVAALYPNLDHHRVDSTGSDMLRELDRTFPLLDIPHAAALNNVWGNLILDHAAASGANVMLCGALGNFAVSYSGADILHTTFRSGQLFKTLRLARYLRSIGLSSGRNAASLTLFSLLPWPLRSRIDPLIRDIDDSWTAIHPARSHELSAVDQMRRHLHTRRTLLPYLMETAFQTNQYGDYNAATIAGWGIDVRDPTADKRVFEFCASIPQEQFIVGGQGRSLIRRAMRGRLPESTLTRAAKGTQAADWYDSLSAIRTQLAAELDFQQRSPGARHLIDLDLLRSAITNWPESVLEAHRNAGIYQSAIPRAMAVGYFIRRIEEEKPTQPHKLSS